MLGAHLPHDAIVEAQLGMGAGADAEVVAELPVIQVVATGVMGTRIGRGFVVLHARFGQPCLDRQLHVSGQVVVRKVGRRSVTEWRIGFEREVIGREMWRLETQRSLDIGHGLGQRLPRQGEHQVEIEGVEMRGGEFGRATCLAVVVNASERPQMTRVEALDAERDARYTRFAETGELGGLHRAGIGLQGDFRTGHQLRQGAHAGEDTVDPLRRKQAGRAAAEEHRVDFSPPDVGQRAFEVEQQRVDVGGFRQGLRSVRVEVAIRALLHAPRQVDVERQRRLGCQAAVE